MRVGFLLFVGFFLWTIAFAQEKNPFELTQSKSNPTMQVVKTTDTSSLGQTKSLPDPTNPFEVVNRKKEQVVADSNKSGQGKLIPAESIKYKEIRHDSSTQKDTNFYFVTLLTLLLFLTILVSLNRSLLLKINQSLLNENMMKYLHRNQVSNFQFTYLLLYFYFFCNLGMFLFFCIQIFEHIGRLFECGSVWNMSRHCMFDIFHKTYCHVDFVMGISCRKRNGSIQLYDPKL